MGFIESVNCLNGVLDNGLVGDGDSNYFDNLELPADCLDFQSLEDDGFGGDWDISMWERLGPIPLDVFTQGLCLAAKARLTPRPKVRLTPRPKIDETLKEKQLPHYVEEDSGSHLQKIADFQESSGLFQSTSPVSELESTGSCPGAKILPIKFSITIPVRKRSKRTRASGVDRWSLIAPLLSTTTSRKKTFNHRKYNEPNRKVFQLSVAAETLINSFDDDGENRVTTKKCSHCAITKTPQWRGGPNGPKTLCNACGVRYRSGRLFPEYRPAASPTFVPSIHSNSHKKVIEMHNKAKLHLWTRIEEHQMSPQPEFLTVSSSNDMFDF